MKQILLTLVLFTIISSLGLLAQSPWEHGQLEVSQSGHTIQHKDGTPFLWIGDTGWGLFQQLTREEVDHYLDNRQKLGFTVIQAVVFWYPHGGGIESGPHNAANAYGHRPFVGDEDAPNTADPLVVEGGSPDAPNDYWDHVDYIIEAIKNRDMYLASCLVGAVLTSRCNLVGHTRSLPLKRLRLMEHFWGKNIKMNPTSFG